MVQHLSRCFKGKSLSQNVHPGQCCVGGLCLASCSSLFLCVACLEAKTLSKEGNTQLLSAAEISLANLGYADLPGANINMFSAFVSPVLYSQLPFLYCSICLALIWLLLVVADM